MLALASHAPAQRPALRTIGSRPRPAAVHSRTQRPVLQAVRFPQAAGPSEEVIPAESAPGAGKLMDAQPAALLWGLAAALGLALCIWRRFTGQAREWREWQVCTAIAVPTGTKTLPVETLVAGDVTGVEGVYCSPDSQLARKVLSAVPALSRWKHWYQAPNWWGKNGHTHTIIAAKTRSTQRVQYHRLLLPTPDGGTVALDRVIRVLPESTKGSHDGVDYVGAPSEEWHRANWDKPFLLLTSGLGGGSQDPYVRSMAAAGLERGFQVGIINMRGCGESPVTSPRFFSAYRGSTDDVRLAVSHARKHFVQPGSLVAAVGWSNGGTIVNNLLAEQATTFTDPSYHVDAGATLACPLDMPGSAANLKRWFHRNVYDRAIAANLVSHFRAGEHLFENGDIPTWNGVDGGTCHIDTEQLLKSKTIWEIDDHLTRKVFGFPSVAHYYAHASSDQRLKDIQVPLLLVNAIDDPIAPGSGIAYDEVRANPNLVLAVTEHGGHLGWCNRSNPWNGPRWTEDIAVSFLARALDLIKAGEA
uniref:AB hydrolase-1 domain-containing protein n=1 Tax=Eutreptiella gymnastica TaxID=73025 RepID=A0A7S1J870_9EUGL